MENLTVLKVFEAADVVYAHCIDTKTDATHILEYGDNFVMTVTRDCAIKNSEGKVVGYFRTNNEGHWCVDGVSFGSTDLLFSERLYFRENVEKFVTQSA